MAPLPEVQEHVESAIAVRKLPFMNDQAHVVRTVHHALLDLIKRNIDGLDLGSPQFEAQVGRCQLAWHRDYGLPDLGQRERAAADVIRRDLGDELINKASRLLFESIRYSLEHREAGMNYAMQFARGLAPEVADEFVGMYVNRRTLDYGADGRAAVRLFLQKGVEAGIVPGPVSVEFAEMAPAGP